MNWRFSLSATRVRDSLWPIGQLAFGSALGYFIAKYGLGHPYPLLAVTVMISSLGFQRATKPQTVLTTALAMLFGIVLSETILLLYGAGTLQLFAAISISLILARLISANPAFALTVAIQATLVQLLQAPSGGVFARAEDGIIGALVALAITALVPRNPIKLARADSKALFLVFKETLGIIRQVLLSPDRLVADAALEKIRRTQPLIDNWKNSLEAAEAIAKISPFYRWAQKEISQQKRILEGMDFATRNLRVVTRRVDHMAKSSTTHPQLASLISKLVIAVDLLEGSSDDFSMAAKSRKYLRKLGPALSVESFEPSLSISELAVLMQIRPLFVDLAMATGMSQDEAVQLLPLVD
ncbi:MAG: FUSC family protein [Aquiluna sp.]|nr:FUSC family protein [Aquiluna sp.]MCF8545437.1 FUSC family protein [Aquiluna sp.]